MLFADTLTITDALSLFHLQFNFQDEINDLVVSF